MTRANSIAVGGWLGHAAGMSDEHTYRVLVRGRFTDLDDAGRGRLSAAADQHDMLTGGFSFRVQLRAEVEAMDLVKIRRRRA